MSKSPIIIVGAGFFGLTLAERIANDLNLPVLVIERRNHIGGNAHSETDEETGIEHHLYGSHLFHTSNKKVWDYVNGFDKFSNYQHTVWSLHDGHMYSLPFNLSTINHFYNLNLSPTEAKIFLESKIPTDIHPLNLEQKAISLVGKDLYEAFIKGYTLKQWQTDPRNLDPNIISRIPVRFNYNNRYFSDSFEGLPLNGYAHLFQQMVKNPLIELCLETDYLQILKELPSNGITIYTGAIDEYFNYEFGLLNWRTLDFKYETVNVQDFQGTSVVNYPDLDVPFTRIHEFRHLHPERNYESSKTLIAKEFSRWATADDEPYYPVNTKEDREKLISYRELLKNEKNIYFGGRLGSYQYLDMHMAVASALALFENQLKPKLLA